MKTAIASGRTAPRPLPLAALLLAATLLLAASASAAPKPKPDPAAPGETRELLSEHKTIARLTAIKYHRCMGLTSFCPDNCGESGDQASFEILAYIDYQKPGEYGDPKSKEYQFLVEDNHKNPKLPKAMLDKVKALQPGDLVILNWRHDYVTRTEAGGGISKFPDRPLTTLEKITQEQADKMMKQAAGKVGKGGEGK